MLRVSSDNARSFPTPQSAYGEMLGALIAGDGLERVVEIAAISVGRPVAIVIPHLDIKVASAESLVEYLDDWSAGDLPVTAGWVSAEVPIMAGDEKLGSVLMMGQGPRHAEIFLGSAATAALTAIAMDNARHETERRLGGSLLEELLTREDLKGKDILRRAKHLGCDLGDGAVGLCVDPGNQPPSRIKPAILAECPNALAQVIGNRVYALVPGGFEDAQRIAGRLGSDVLAGISSHYSDASDARYALEEADLMLDLNEPEENEGDAEESIDNDTFRLLFRVLASHPEEMRRFSEKTIGPILRHDEQYSTDLVPTLRAYLHEYNCNMNLTAKSIFAHRHTVSNRLARVEELTGLDPFRSEDRERLGLALKAQRIVDRRPAA